VASDGGHETLKCRIAILCLEDDRTDCGERTLDAAVELGIQPLLLGLLPLGDVDADTDHALRAPPKISCAAALKKCNRFTGDYP